MKRLLLLALLAFAGLAARAQVSWDALLTGNCNEVNTGETAVITPSGATYFAGHFRGNLFMGFNSATADNTNDVFLCKGDASGNVNWLRSFGNRSYVDVADMVVSGNSILVGGTFTDTLILGTDTLLNSNQKGIYLAEYDTLGNYIRSFAPPCHSASIHGITRDSSGHILVTGEFGTSMDLGAQTLTTVGSFNFFLFKYDMDQDTVFWGVQSIGTTTLGDQVSCDPQGNVYVAGSYGDGVMLDTVTLNNDNTNHNIFVASYGPNGNFRWVQQFYGLSENHGYGIAVSPQGTVFVTGEFETQLEFDSTAILFSSGQYDVIVCALDTMGEFIWNKGFGGSDSDEGYSITTDENGDAILLCEAGIGITVDGVPLEPNGFNEPLVMKLHHSDGSLIWGKRIFADAGSGIVQASQVSYSNGQAVVVGTNRSRIDFNSTLYTAPNLKDFYLAFFSDSLTYHLGVDDHVLSHDPLEAYPNPFDQQVKVKMEQDGILNLHAMDGRLISSFTLESGVQELDLGYLRSGFYVISTQCNGNLRSMVLVKR